MQMKSSKVYYVKVSKAWRDLYELECPRCRCKMSYRFLVKDRSGICLCDNCERPYYFEKISEKKWKVKEISEEEFVLLENLRPENGFSRWEFPSEPDPDEQWKWELEHDEDEE